jgi:hypothetical protein
LIPLLPSRLVALFPIVHVHWMWPMPGGGFTSVSLSTRTVWILLPLAPIAMASSSRQTPGSRVEYLERNDTTRLLPLIPSVI